MNIPGSHLQGSKEGFPLFRTNLGNEWPKGRNHLLRLYPCPWPGQGVFISAFCGMFLHYSPRTLWRYHVSGLYHIWCASPCKHPYPRCRCCIAAAVPQCPPHPPPAPRAESWKLLSSSKEGIRIISHNWFHYNKGTVTRHGLINCQVSYADSQCSGDSKEEGRSCQGKDL